MILKIGDIDLDLQGQICHDKFVMQSQDKHKTYATDLKTVKYGFTISFKCN